GIGQTQESDIGEQTQLQPQPARLAGRARRGLPRRAIDAALEARVADAVKTAPGYQQTLARLEDLTDQFFGFLVMHHGADRDRDHQILAAAAGAVVAAAILAALGAETAG